MQRSAELPAAAAAAVRNPEDYLFLLLLHHLRLLRRSSAAIPVGLSANAAARGSAPALHICGACLNRPAATSAANGQKRHDVVRVGEAAGRLIRIQVLDLVIGNV